jgi:hypothetical protein
MSSSIDSTYSIPWRIIIIHVLLFILLLIIAALSLFLVVWKLLSQDVTVGCR